MGRKVTRLILALLTAALWSVVGAAPDLVKLRILHTNDMHSRFEEISQRYATCGKADKELNKCYGGFARIATLIRQLRDEAPEELPTFFLNAGDTYLGTKLFTHYKWEIVSRFLNILRPDVASLGNHELDLGPDGLVPFLNNISFPVVAANLDLSEVPAMQKAKQLRKSVILTAKALKIGVVGYLTPETKQLSQAGKLEILEEVPAIREEAKLLKSQGCDMVIALGHSGFEVDKQIGREVDDVDLVIGGHTNTFLYNGPAPDTETPEGPYPYVVVQPSGRKVYVVQAFAYTKYLGSLDIDWDPRRREIARIQGQPILVNASIAQAQDVEQELQTVWVEKIGHWAERQIGFTRVLLQGDEKICRLQECNFGNLLTDAMIYHNTKLFNDDNGWTDAAIAIHQAGGIRASIGTINENKVTWDDIITALPFGSRLFKIEVSAKTLWKALEWSVHDRLDHNTTSHGGCFLQYSGLQVTYDISKPLNSRVISARVRCSQCIVPTYHELDMNASYPILITDFMYNGGDGFDMFKDTPYTNLNVTVADVVSEYINHTSPVYPSVEGRIKFISSIRESLSSSSSTKINIKNIYVLSMLGISVLLYLIV